MILRGVLTAVARRSGDEWCRCTADVGPAGRGFLLELGLLFGFGCLDKLRPTLISDQAGRFTHVRVEPALNMAFTPITPVRFSVQVPAAILVFMVMFFPSAHMLSS